MIKEYLTILSCFMLLCAACHRPIKSSFLQSTEVQLSKPNIRVEEVFFHDFTQVYIGELQEGCYMYLAKGHEAYWEEQPISEDSLTISASSTLTFRSSGGGFLPSEEVVVELFKIKNYIVSIEATASPTAPYDEATAEILIDKNKGSKNFRDGHWIGYQESELSFEIELTEGAFNGVVLSCLEDQNSWIFMPASIKVSYFDLEGKLISQVYNQYEADREQVNSSFKYLRLGTVESSLSKIRLDIQNLVEIPNWHPGKGTTPWLFIDEIILL